MQVVKHSICFAVVVHCFGAVDLWAQSAPTEERVREKHNTADFINVEKRIAEFLTGCSAEDVLLVVDIDNTLLAMNQDLGSDQWFNWQSDLLKVAPGSRDLVADDFAGLLRVQGKLFALSSMHPPEPALPAMINRIQQNMKVTTVVLTSRGPEFRNAAERELKNNGYGIMNSTNTLRINEKRGLFKPFDPKQPDAHGLTEEIVSTIGDRLRDVTYANGIYMTAGQHKGYMLKTLLARSIADSSKTDMPREFKVILLVDDHQGHTEDVHAAFADDDVDLVTFHYMQEDGNVKKFNDSSKRHVVRDWSGLQEFIETVLVK